MEIVYNKKLNHALFLIKWKSKFEAWVWDFNENKVIKTMEFYYKNDWKIISVLSTEKYIAISTLYSVFIYDWSYNLLLEIDGFSFNTYGPDGFAFSPCNKFFLKTSQDHNRLFHLEKIFSKGIKKISLNEIKTQDIINLRSSGYELYFSGDGRYIISYDAGYFYIEDIQTKKDVYKKYTGGYNFACSSYGKYFVVSYYYGETREIILIDAETKEEKFKFESSIYIGDIKWIDENTFIFYSWCRQDIFSLSLNKKILKLSILTNTAIIDEDKIINRNFVPEIINFPIPTKSLEKFTYHKSLEILIESSIIESIVNFI